MGRPKKQVAIEPLEINEPEEQPIKPLEKTEVSDEEVDTFEEVFETPAKKPRKKMNLTDEERERRRIRLRLNNEKYLEEKKLKKLQAKYEEEEEKKRVHEELQNIKDDLVIKKAKKVMTKNRVNFINFYIKKNLLSYLITNTITSVNRKIRKICNYIYETKSFLVVFAFFF